MDWKRKIKSSFLILLLGIASTAVIAEEMLWRATNEEVSDIVPDYDYELNPFPIKEAPFVQEIEEEMDMEIDFTQAANASMLERIRQMLTNKRFVEPDILSLRVQGYLEGQNSPLVLINSQWFKKGNKVHVPAKQMNEFKRLVEELEVSAPSLWESIAGEIKERLEKLKRFELTISSINPDKITLVDSRGEPYVISYVAGDL